MTPGIVIHKAVEFLAENRPEALKSRMQTKHFLMAVCFRYVKRHNCPKDWDAYLRLIKVLMDEYCVRS